MIKVIGMQGLGDNIYQRPFIKTLAKPGEPVELTTPWPQLYTDIPNVRLLRPSRTTLRTQAKNVGRSTFDGIYHGIDAANPPKQRRTPNTRQAPSPTIAIGYSRMLSDGSSSIPGAMRKCTGVEPEGLLELPDFKPPFLRLPDNRPIAMVRPVTIRKEWRNVSRNPDPKYVAEAAAELMRLGYYVISIADIKKGHEWIVEPEPSAHVKLHKGELRATEILSLTQLASAVVGGVGWILPAAMAYRTPTLIIAGGSGGWNAPEVLTDPESMDTSTIRWILPENYCRCRALDHDCPKTISGFRGKLSDWLKGIATNGERASA